jgi:hypothetical protein
MTLGEIKQKVRMIGLHHFGSKQDLDPFGLEYLVLETANQIARKTDCLFGRRYLDIVSGTDEYCSPDMYRIRGVFKLDNNDYKRVRLLDFADRKVDAYRTQGNAVLDACILYGTNKLRFLPTPADSVTNGIMIEGYCQPGMIWQYDINGNPVALSDTQECPLPDSAHDCLVYGVLYARAMQMKDVNVLALYKGEYLDRLGVVESNSAIYGRRTV